MYHIWKLDSHLYLVMTAHFVADHVVLLGINTLATAHGKSELSNSHTSKLSYSYLPIVNIVIYLTIFPCRCSSLKYCVSFTKQVWHQSVILSINIIYIPLSRQRLYNRKIITGVHSLLPSYNLLPLYNCYHAALIGHL